MATVIRLMGFVDFDLQLSLLYNAVAIQYAGFWVGLKMFVLARNLSSKKILGHALKSH